MACEHELVVLESRELAWEEQLLIACKKCGKSWRCHERPH